MALFALLALSGIVGYAAFQRGGAWEQDWNPCLLSIAALALLYWLTTRRLNLAPPLGRAARRLLMAVPLVFLLQFVPLPAAVVRLVSPARFELDRASTPVLELSGWLPISVAPASTVFMLLTVVGVLLVFFLAREIAWRLQRWPWAAAVPLIVLGVLEAVLGLVQSYTPGTDGIARGTLVNRNHYAALLEMAIPLAVVWGLWTLLHNRARHSTPLQPVLAACGLFSCGALMLVAIIHSQSRMGFTSALVSLAVLGIIAWSAGRHPAWRWLPVPALLIGTLSSFIFLPTDALIERFAEWAGPAEISSDTRAEVWRDSMHVIAAYPLLGSGLGTYESVMPRFNTAAPMNAVDFAHNDYVQLAAEGGVVGLGVVLGAIVLVITPIARRAGSPVRTQGAFVALACCSSLTAILLHSFSDFNLHIPVNAMIAAWVAGIASGPE